MQGVDSLFVFGTAAFETHAAVVFAVGMHCCIVVSSAPVFGRLIQPPRPSALHFAKKKSQPGLRLSILHLQARAHAAPRLSKKRFEFAFRRIFANH